MSVLRCLRIFQNESCCYQEQKMGSDETVTSIKYGHCVQRAKSWHHNISRHCSVPVGHMPTINRFCCNRQPPIFPWRGIQGSAGRSGVWSLQMDPDFHRHGEGGSTKVKDMEKWERSKKQNRKNMKNHSVHEEKHHGKRDNQTDSTGFIVDSKC